jgi:iron complex outermembrane receptor protein
MNIWEGNYPVKNALLCGGSVLAVALSLCASQAIAADATAEAAAPGAVAEITVVAEKREQNIEAVPVAISAFSAEQRNLVGIKSIQDISDFTPGLNYNSIANRPYLRGIGRNTDNLATASAVAIYYNGIYDGANANTILQKSDLFIDTVEVDRGPQNALHGSNADGGTINYISKKPTHEFYAEGRAGAGNFGRYFGEAVVSGPLNDNVRIRLGGNYTSESGGYFHNFDGPPQGGDLPQGNSGNTHYLEGQIDANYGHLDVWAMLTSQGYDTNYKTVASLGTYPTNFIANGAFTPNAFYGLCGLPGFVGSANDVGSLAGNHGCNPANPVLGVTALGTTANNFPGNNPANVNPRNFIEEFTSTNDLRNDVAWSSNVTYHFPTFDATYLAGYQVFDYILNFTGSTNPGLTSFTLGGAPAAGANCTANAVNLNFNAAACTQPLTIFAEPSTTYFVEKDRFFSHELDFTSTAPGPLQWVAGAYWYQEKYEQPVDAGVQPRQTQLAHPVYQGVDMNGVPCANPGGAAAAAALCAAPINTASAVSKSDTVLSYNSYAGFFQADYKFSDKWKISGAIRYTEDDKSGFQTWRFETFDTNPLSLITGNLSQGAATQATDVTRAVVCGGGLCAKGFPGAGVAFPTAGGDFRRNLNANWSAVTGEGGIDFTPDPSLLAYFKYSRGYKSGGFSTFTIAANPETQAESVDAFEWGAKKTVGSKLTLNGAVFYDNYDNDQIPLNVQQSSGLIAAQLFNLKEVHIWGVELEGIWRPIDPLTLSLQYSHLDATVANAGACFADTVDPLALQPGNNINGCLVPDPAHPGSFIQETRGGANISQNINGQTLPEATPDKVSFNGIYTWTFDPGKLILSTSVIWKAATYGSLFNRPYSLAPDYTLVNFRLTWRDAKDRYSVIGYVNNATDALGFDNATGTLLQAGTTPAGTPNPEIILSNRSFTAPRTFGVEFQFRFR